MNRYQHLFWSFRTITATGWEWLTYTTRSQARKERERFLKDGQQCSKITTTRGSHE